MIESGGQRHRGRLEAALTIIAATMALLCAWTPSGALAKGGEVQTLAYRDFVDVGEGEWYVTGGMLDYAVDMGLFSGYDDGTNRFGPYDDVTRGQVAVILHRIAGEPEADAQDFSDVNYDWYYGGAIEWARSTGVINGYDDGTNRFGPDVAVTREQLAVMLANYAENVANIDATSGCVALDRIQESNLVSSWAREQMGWAVDEGILSGVEIGGTSYVRPQGTAERCQAVKMMSVFHRDVLGLGDQGEDDPNDSIEGLPSGPGIEYTPQVRDGGEYLSLSNTRTSATMSSEKAEGIEPGDIVLFDQTKDYPGGVAIKVSQIESNGATARISGSTPDLTEIYEEYDVEETAYVDPSNFTPANGIEVLSEDSVGTLSDGEFYSKRIPIKLSSIDLGDYGEATGTLYIKPGVIFDLHLLKESRLGVIGTAQLDGTVEVEALPAKYRHIEIGRAQAFGIKGWGAALIFYLNLDLEGKITVSTEIDYEASINTRKGPIGKVKPSGTTVDAKVDAEIALEANAAFELFTKSVGETGLEAGMHGSASTIDRPNSTLVCTDLSSYMFLNFAWDLLEGIDLDAVYLDGDAELIKESNSPLKLKLHFENGEKVPECTWDKNAGSGNDDDTEQGNPGQGTGTIDPTFDGIPIIDEGYGDVPIWTMGDDGRAEISEPFYVDAGNMITVRAPKDCSCGSMFVIDGGNSLIRKTTRFDSGKTYVDIMQGSYAFSGDIEDLGEVTVEVLVGRMEVLSLWGRGDSATRYVPPIVKIEPCESFDYPVQLSATVVNLKVGETYSLRYNQTVDAIYSAIAADYEGTDDWSSRSSDTDVVQAIRNIDDNEVILTAKAPGEAVINICYGHKPLSTRSGFNRQCKVIVTE